MNTTKYYAKDFVERDSNESPAPAMERSVLIIGAGTFGTSTAYHLATTYKDASKVTIIDQAPSPPKPAAAIDVNRIIRTDYPNKLYCNLANEAIHAWFWSLELQRYFHKVGWIHMDEKDSDLSDRVRQVFRDREYDPTEDIPLDQLDEKYAVLEGTKTDGFRKAYFTREAGWCDAALATASFMEAAVKRGVNRVTARVTELIFDADKGRIEGVRTADGQHLKADQIVLAAGAWTSGLLSPVEDKLNMPEDDRIERQVQAAGRVAAYYKLSDEEVKQFSKPRMPVICYGEQGEVIPPSDSNKTLTYRNSATTFTNTVKTKSGAKISIPSSRDQHNVPEKLKQATAATITSKVMPDFVSDGRQADHWRICWDAVTPTEDWLMCKHPHSKLDNLHLAVGGSFHSYK